MDETPPAPPPPRPPQAGIPGHAGPTDHGGHGGHGGRRFVREPDDRKIAGVCGGLADYLGLDVTLVRVGAVVLALLTPAAIVAYVVAAVVVPERRPGEPRHQAGKVHLGGVPGPLLVVGAIVAVAAFIDEAWWLDPFPAAVALVGVGVWLVLQNRDDDEDAGSSGDGAVTVSQQSGTDGGQRTTFEAEPGPDPSEPRESGERVGSLGEPPPPASPWWSGTPAAPSPPAPPRTPSPAAPAGPPDGTHRSSRLGPTMIALLLIGGGTLWLLVSLDTVTVSAEDAMALGLLVAGTGLLVAAWLGRAYVLIPIGLVLATVLLVDDVLDVPLDAGTGDRTVMVDTTGELRETHELLAGELTLDLRDAPLSATGTPRVEAAVGMGELVVIVPGDATVEVDASTSAGEILAPSGPGIDEGGVAVDRSFTLEGEPGGPELELDLSVGFGNVEVVRG